MFSESEIDATRWLDHLKGKMSYYDVPSPSEMPTNSICLLRPFTQIEILRSFFFFFYFTILYWFCQTSTWILHGCTCVPHPALPSHLRPHTIPLGHPSAPALSILYHASNLDWWFVSRMILYMIQCLRSMKMAHKNVGGHCSSAAQPPPSLIHICTLQSEHITF